MKKDFDFDTLIKQLEETIKQASPTKDPVQELQDELNVQIDSVSKILEVAKKQQAPKEE